MSATVVVATAYGGPEVLALRDAPIPEPGPGQALLEVRAAGVNPIDWKRYSGAFGTDPAQLPMRLGSEAAGVVDGHEVIAFRIEGAYASHVVVPEAALVPKPPSLSWEVAGGLMLAGEGKLTVPVHAYALAEVAAAHAASRAGHATGKLVLVP